MEFGITVEIDAEAHKKSPLIHDLADDLSNFISPFDFGAGIERILIGFVCILTQPGYENWYKERKPRFTKADRIFCFDIKIDGEKYESFVASTDNESKKLLATEILNGLNKIDEIPKNIKDFNRDLFKMKVTEYLKENIIREKAI